MFRKILVPVDTADPAVGEPAVYFAAQLASLTNAWVRMLHVLSPIPFHLDEILPSHVKADREKDARAVLLDMAKKANVPMGRFSHALRTGAVADEVLAEAEFWMADLIILGSHHPSAKRFLLGSNADKIVHHANCSVMVVRPPKYESGTYWLVPQIGS
jgi:nucleotide-binding universal stress UspA family protein